MGVETGAEVAPFALSLAPLASKCDSIASSSGGVGVGLVRTA